MESCLSRRSLCLNWARAKNEVIRVQTRDSGFSRPCHECKSIENYELIRGKEMTKRSSLGKELREMRVVCVHGRNEPSFRRIQYK